MSTVDGWVLEGCSGAVGRNRPWLDRTDWMARSGGTGGPAQAKVDRWNQGVIRRRANSRQSCAAPIRMTDVGRAGNWAWGDPATAWCQCSNAVWRRSRVVSSNATRRICSTFVGVALIVVTAMRAACSGGNP